MNRKELSAALIKMTDAEFRQFVGEFGGIHPNPESVVRAFVSKQALEPRICQLLDLETEEEKAIQAALDAAKSAKVSSIVAVISAIMAIVAVIVMILK